MSTLYWITVLGNLNIVAQVALFLFLVAAFFTGICTKIDESEGDKSSRTLIKAFRISSISTIIAFLMVLFIPSTEQLYAIYGVGTVIDYAKGSKEVQKLPDNAVKALNVWLENVNKDKKDSLNKD